MTSYARCTAITAAGTQCTRAAVVNGLCTQHYNMSTRSTVPASAPTSTPAPAIESKDTQALPPDIMKFGVSAYISYDDLSELSKGISNLHIDPARIRVKKYITYDEDESDEQLDYVGGDYEYNPTHTQHLHYDKYIDGILRHTDLYRVQEPEPPVPTQHIIQSTRNYNARGQLDGPQYTYNYEGELQYKQKFVNGLEDGPQYEYYSSGMVYTVGNNIMAAKNLQAYTVRNYTNGVRSGTSTKYYKDGKVKSVKEWDNDKIVGTATEYYENGGVAKVEHYNNGKLNGTSTEYYADGISPHIVVNYVDGLLNGAYTVYSPTGAITTLKHYKNNVELKRNESVYDYVRK